MVEQLSKLKEQVYRDPRPKEHFDRFHERARTREPDAVYEVVRIATTFLALTAFRARSIASDNVPATGPVILAPNHFSFMDHFFVGIFIRRRVRFMAKSQLFTPPMQWVFSHGGVFPVRRGHHDEEAFITAEGILGRGGTVVMYCEGGRSRSGIVGEKGARPGIGRLALETGAPIVPVAIHGSSKVRNWKKLQFPKVTVRYGEAFAYERVDQPDRGQQLAVAEAILERIKGLYDELDRDGARAVAARVRAQRAARLAT
jgi:1-acyl-sn-glycerol-3-phosphate acyltransferase